VKETDLESGIKRTCLIYYFLAWWGDRRHIKYSDDERISTQFAELTHAYYFLDNGDTLVSVTWRGRLFARRAKVSSLF
jgi:hypothetical protein